MGLIRHIKLKRSIRIRIHRPWAMGRLRRQGEHLLSAQQTFQVVMAHRRLLSVLDKSSLTMDLAGCDQHHPQPQVCALSRWRRVPTTIHRIPWIRWSGLDKLAVKFNRPLPAHPLWRFDLTLGWQTAVLRIILEMTCRYLQSLRRRIWDHHQSLPSLQGRVLG